MTEDLQLIRTLGFNGKLISGFHIHPDGINCIYALGSRILIQNLENESQTFLQGHTNTVSCLTVSKSGKFIASGQETHMGFKADIIVWDYERKTKFAIFNLHKVRVEALSFSCKDKYLVSLGGQDDGSVVVWSLEDKEAVCGANAAIPSAGNAIVVKCANENENQFVTAGDLTLRVWNIDRQNRKIRPDECQMGLFKRHIKCVEVAKDDSYFLAGTTSGDFLKVNMQTCKLINCGLEKNEMSRGVSCINILDDGNLLVGTGAGRVALVKGNGSKKYPSIKEFNVDTKKCGNASITSVALRTQGSEVFVGTSQAEIYKLKLDDSTTQTNSKAKGDTKNSLSSSSKQKSKNEAANWVGEQIVSCHHNKVRDITFFQGTSDLFATCGDEDIRIWDAKRFREILRIREDNLVCNAIEFSPDGKSIVSAWNDNTIRTYSPKKGLLLYKINNAHNLGVTALSVTPDSTRIVSGGGEGQVRVWDLTLTKPLKQDLRETMKEHKSKISCIKIKSNGLECVSSSEDGTVIIWDLERFVRLQMVMANTLFECVCYHPEEYQILTSGTDRKVVYWETYDGSQIRELDASETGGINGLDIDNRGKLFCTGGDDTILKVWDYQEGQVKFTGHGHADAITKTRISPNNELIVSVSADGGVVVWKYPSC